MFKVKRKMCPVEGREIEGRMAPGFHGKTAVCDAKPLKGQGGGPFLTRRQLYKQRLCRTYLPLNEMDNSLLYFRYFSHQRKFQIFKFSRLAQVAHGLPTIDPNPRDSSACDTVLPPGTRGQAGAWSCHPPSLHCHRSRYPHVTVSPPPVRSCLAAHVSVCEHPYFLVLHVTHHSWRWLGDVPSHCANRPLGRTTLLLCASERQRVSHSPVSPSGGHRCRNE